MSSEHPGFRIFILGAGFSRLAGLPLATELYTLVRQSIENKHGKNTKFQGDIEKYIEYRKSCDGLDLSENQIDLEEFMSFLDMEHFLELRGSKAWSQEGNESQIMVRKAIGKVIHEKTPVADELPQAYYDFANNLTFNDIVITFNYDVLLERALEYVGKPYRLFPSRFKEIGRYSNTVDDSIEEVVVLKMHGSVDWFDNKVYLELLEGRQESGATSPLIHSVFGNPNHYNPSPIVDGPRSQNDPLLNIHKIQNADLYYNYDNGFNAPFILSPSHVKFVYSAPLLGFWHGMGRSGGWNLGISVIGFSLPQHDEYIRVGLYQMILNYQQSWWDEKWLGKDILKDNVRLVDFRESMDGINDFKSRYSFVDSSRAEYFFGGFNTDAINFLFNQPRKV
jgi:SIR2-like domain